MKPAMMDRGSLYDGDGNYIPRHEYDGDHYDELSDYLPPGLEELVIVRIFSDGKETYPTVDPEDSARETYDPFLYCAERNKVLRLCYLIEQHENMYGCPISEDPGEGNWDKSWTYAIAMVVNVDINELRKFNLPVWEVEVDMQGHVK